MWTAFRGELTDCPPPPPCGAVYIRSWGWVSEAVAPWSLQLRRYKLTDSGWQRSDAPLSSRHWSKFLFAKTGSALWSTLQTVPADVLDLARKFGAWRHTATELLALTPLARQLADSAPNLFWMVCAAWESPSKARVRDPAIFQMKRLSLLKWALGSGAQSSQLEFLEKMHPGTRSRSLLLLLRWVFNHPVQQNLLGGLTVIHDHALKHVRTVDTEYWTPVLGALLSSECEPSQDVLEAHSQTVRDIFRLADDLHLPRSEPEQRIQACADLEGLKAVHQDLMTQHHLGCEVPCPFCNDEGETCGMICPACGGTGWLFEVATKATFPPPPVPGTESVVYLQNARALIIEGKEMHHCVGSYANAAAAGECFIYKVLAPERATVEVSVDARGRARIAQAKGPCNGELTQDTHEALKEWVTGAPAGSHAQNGFSASTDRRYLPFRREGSAYGG